MPRERSAIEMTLTSMNAPGATLRVLTHTSTGTDPKTRPGVSFDFLVPDEFQPLPRAGGILRVPFGVVDRDQIRALRNLLADFLLDYPE